MCLAALFFCGPSRRALCLLAYVSRTRVYAMPKTSGKATKKRKQDASNFKTYIARVLRQVHPKLTISKRSVQILNSLVQDSFEKISEEAQRLVKRNKRQTLTSREVQTAIRLVFPGELAKHAVSEGTKAVTKFSNA